MIGDCVHDMHNGIHTFPHKVKSHIRVDTQQNPCRTINMGIFIESVLDGEHPAGYPHRCENKIAYLTGENEDGDWQAMYTYDGMWFGIIEFEPPE